MYLVVAEPVVAVHAAKPDLELDLELHIEHNLELVPGSVEWRSCQSFVVLHYEN